MAYDWQADRQTRLNRMAALAGARQRMSNAEKAKFEKEQERLAMKEQEAALDNSRGAFGMAGMGASIGALGGPVGAGIGAGAGLLLGGLAEAKNRQRIQGGGFMKNLGQSLLRAPSMQELPAMASGAMGAYGAVSKANALAGAGQAGANQMNQQFAAEREARNFDNKLRFKSSMSNIGSPYTPEQEALYGMFPTARR